MDFPKINFRWRKNVVTKEFIGIGSNFIRKTFFAKTLLVKSTAR